MANLLFTGSPISRFLFLTAAALWLSPCFSQNNAFTDGLSWVSSSPTTTAQSPVFQSDICQDIHYTLSTTSALDFQYNPGAVNGAGVIFPAYSNTQGNTMLVTITFNVPVQHFGMRILDLDEDNQHNGGPPDEYLDGVSPAPGTVTSIPGVHPIFISGTTITPDDGNAANFNSNASGWVYWPGEVTTVSFTYHRISYNYEFVLDSLHFECPCPASSDHIANATICPAQSHAIDATTPNATYEWSTGSTSPTITVANPGVYWVNVHRGTCLETDTSIISLIPVPDLGLGNDTAICTGESLLITANPLLMPITWQTGTIGNALLATTSGTYIASAVYSGCPVKDTLVLTVNAYPSVDLGSNRTLCNGTTTLLQAPAGNYTYQWSNGSSQQILQTNTEGTFWVNVSNDGCAASDTVIVKFKPLPPDPLPADTTICSSDLLSVVLSSTTGAAYEWYSGSTENTIAVPSGSYWVESTLNGCSRTDTLRIAAYPTLGSAVAFDSTLLICEGKSGTIGPKIASDLVDLVWDDGSTASEITVHEAGTHYFTVSTPCESRTYGIPVTTEKCFCTVYLPNTFTPDNKYANEVFGPVYECALDRYELQIFNRWGQTVFSSTDPDAAWDGTFNGLPVPDGVYLYTLVYTSADTQDYRQLSGHVSVLR